MENKNIHIFFIKHTEKLPDAVFQEFLLRLPFQFQTEIKAYKHWQSAQVSLLGKMLLAYAFQQLRYEHLLQDILVGVKDRPFIDNAVDFNISHSGAYVMVAVAEHGRVGVDIEKHRSLNPALFQKYFDAMEWQEIQQSEDLLQTFFELWTIKESAIKCDGRGVEVLSGTHKQYEPQQIKSVICDTTLLHYETMEIEDGYAACVCSNSPFQYTLIETVVGSLL